MLLKSHEVSKPNWRQLQPSRRCDSCSDALQHIYSKSTRGAIRKGDPAETDKKMACMTATGKQPNLSHDLSPSTQSLTVSVFVVTGVESTKSPLSRIPQREVKGVSFIQAETHCLRFFSLYA